MGRKIDEKDREEAKNILDGKEPNSGFEGIIDVVAKGLARIRTQAAKAERERLREPIKDIIREIIRIGVIDVRWIANRVTLNAVTRIVN